MVALGVHALLVGDVVVPAVEEVQAIECDRRMVAQFPLHAQVGDERRPPMAAAMRARSRSRSVIVVAVMPPPR